MHGKTIMTDEHYSPIELTEDYVLGVSQIDTEHKKLVEIYNQLVAAIATDNARQLRETTLLQLFDYAAYHFVNEEKVMLASDFPGYQSHCRQHINFTESLNRLSADADQQSPEAALELLTIFVGQWIRGHILISDKQIGEHLLRLPTVL